MIFNTYIIKYVFHTGTVNSISFKGTWTWAFKRTYSILACGMLVAIFVFIVTLVDIWKWFENMCYRYSNNHD